MALRRRGNEDREVIGVLGGFTGLGLALVERLAGRADVEAVIALEELPGPGSAVTTLVQLGPGSLDVLLEAARALRLRRVVVCTSAHAYAVRSENPVPLPDDSPLRASEQDADELALAEAVIARARRGGLSITVLRPADLVGVDANAEGPWLRQLRSPRMLAVRGVEPLWQLCHGDDLVSAAELAAVGAVAGDLGVACEGALPQLLVEQLAGKRRLELPASVAMSTAERLYRLGITAASPRELDHLLAPLVLACDGLRAAGWEPTWTNEAALQAHLLAMRSDPHQGVASSDGRTAVYGAAGATVALLGTAALVRQTRRRRRR